MNLIALYGLSATLSCQYYIQYTYPMNTRIVDLYIIIIYCVLIIIQYCYY